MNDRHRPSMHFLKFLDVFLLVLAFGLSTVFVVRADRSVSLAQFLAIRTKVSDFLLFGLALFLCHLVLCLCGLYRPVRVARRRAEIANVLPATALCVACFVALGWVFFIRMITLQFLAVFWALSTTILCAARQFPRLVLDYIHLRGRNLRYMLILGTNPALPSLPVGFWQIGIQGIVCWASWMTNGGNSGVPQDRVPVSEPLRRAGEFLTAQCGR